MHTIDTTLNSILIPEQLDLSRQPNPKDHLSKEDVKKFDTKTLFYDVFIDQSGTRLVAIGPPAINLSDYVNSARLYIDGQRKRYSFQDYPEYKLSVLEASISPCDHLRAEFIFHDFSKTLDIHRNPTPTEKCILAAISKDNAPEWVATWADFHRHNYDIDEIIVYDNGSNNLDELKAALKDKAHIIEWSFPYGPPKKRSNKFAQPGALNHCLRKYGKGGTLYNFDIDELLIADKKKLENELTTNGTVYIESHNVPLTRQKPSSYTHYNFTLRQPERRNKARKFVCRTDSVDLISQHNTWKRTRIPLLNKHHRAKPEKLKSHHAYFLHFLAITTNWQPDLGKLDIVCEDGLEKDTSHIERMP